MDNPAFDEKIIKKHSLYLTLLITLLANSNNLLMLDNINAWDKSNYWLVTAMIIVVPWIIIVGTVVALVDVDEEKDEGWAYDNPMFNLGVSAGDTGLTSGGGPSSAGLALGGAPSSVEVAILSILFITINVLFGISSRDINKNEITKHKSSCVYNYTLLDRFIMIALSCGIMYCFIYLTHLFILTQRYTEKGLTYLKGMFLLTIVYYLYIIIKKRINKAKSQKECDLIPN